MAADPQVLPDTAAHEALALLNELRKQTIAAILSAHDPLSLSYKALLAEIDGLIATYQRQFSGQMVAALQQAAEAGDAAVLADAKASGVETPLSYVGVSPQLVRTASEYATSLVSALSDDASARIGRAVRLAALGGKSTTELVNEIGRNLTDASTFRTIADRAEAIARTETSRVINTAWFEQASQLADRYTGMSKVWEHTVGSVGSTKHQRQAARPSHVRLWEETTAKPIPFSQRFDLGGGITCDHPHAWDLPASHTVNCRCRLRLVPSQAGG